MTLLGDLILFQLSLPHRGVVGVKVEGGGTMYAALNSLEKGEVWNTVVVVILVLCSLNLFIYKLVP